MQALRTLIPPTIPRVDEIGLDGTVLGFGLFITIACGLFFGMVPAARGARANLLSAMTQSGRGVLGSSRECGGTASSSRRRVSPRCWWSWRRCCCKAWCGCSRRRSDSSPSGVMTARVSVPRAKYPDAAATLAFQRTLLGSLETLPSVRAVGLMTSAPFAPGVRRGVTLRDRAAAGVSPDAPASAVEQVVSPGLFRALGVKLLAGREFEAQDQPGSPLVAIVSEGLARRLWASTDAIGRVLEFDGRSHEVVGVVEDIRGSDGIARGGGLDRDPQAVLYLSSAQFPQNTVSLVIRTDAQLQAILPAIRAAVREIDPDAAGPRPASPRRVDRRKRGAAAPDDDPRGGVCRGGAVPHGCGDLWSHLLCRQPADAGNRRADGHRRRSGPRSLDWCSAAA